MSLPSWPSHPSLARFQGTFLLTHIKAQLHNPQWQDLTIRTCGHTFTCHSVVLAAACPLLREMLRGQVGDGRLIVLVGYSKQEVEQFLTAAYGLVDIDRSEAPVLLEDLCFLPDQTISVKHELYVDQGVELEVKEGKWMGWKEDADMMEDDLPGNESDSSEKPNKYDSDKDYEPEKIKSKKKENKPRVKSGTPVKWGNKPKFSCPYCGIQLKQLPPKHVAKLHPAHWEEFNAAKGSGKRSGRVRQWPRKCEFCEKVLASKWHYDKHLRSHSRQGHENHLEDEFICDICGNSFHSKSLLESHVRSHQKDVSCPYSECDQSFRDKNQLNEHMLMEHKIIQATNKKEPRRGPGSILCTVCGKGFHSTGGLKSHIMIMHGDLSSTSYPCNICGRVCTSKSQHKKHIALHNVPALPCPVCGKMFHTKDYVLRHVKVSHTADDQKKYQCDVCNKGFTSTSNLEGHMNWHRNIKPFNCQWCSNSYQNKSNLNAHQKKNHRKEWQEKVGPKNYRIQTRAIVDDMVGAEDGLEKLDLGIICPEV